MSGNIESSTPIALKNEVTFKGGVKLPKGLLGQTINIISTPEGTFLAVVFPDYLEKGTFIIKKENASLIYIQKEGRKGYYKSLDMLTGRLPAIIKWEDGEEEVQVPEDTPVEAWPDEATQEFREEYDESAD